MAIDFKVVDKGAVNFRKAYMSVLLPDTFPAFLLSSSQNFTSSASKLLYSIDPYGDTLLSNDDLKNIQQLCEQICKIFANVQNYSIYDELKRYNIKVNDLMVFANSMQCLISFAFMNDKDVWVVGD